MKKKIKIVVVGIGGVGGYYGGLLAKKYSNSNEVEIIFVARGEHLKQIQNNGLKVIVGTGEFISAPTLATDNAQEIGTADYIIICTKNYDLETTIEQIKPCIDTNTILLPLLNGVDGVERIKHILPGTTVLNGCVYIVSRLKEPGVIENMGNIQSLYFGIDNTMNDRLILLEKLLKDASIQAILSENISTIVWEKFIFISSSATATSYFDSSFGKLIAETPETIMKLIDEVKEIALAKGIRIDKDIAVKTFNFIKSLPYETTSSMHRDYKNLKSQTEVESLTGYIVHAGQQLHIETPTFNKAYKKLTNNNSN